MIELLKQELNFLNSLEYSNYVNILIKLYNKILNHDNPEKHLLDVYKSYCWNKIGITSIKKFRPLKLSECHLESNIDFIIDSLKVFII